MQKINVELFGPNAPRFCLGYWDWGYQGPFNNNLRASTYNYIFRSGAVGTLNSGGNIPDGRFANLQSPQGNANSVTRCPSPGNNNWSTASISACIRLRDIEGNDDGNVGFRPCFEYNAHAAIHNSLGCNMASFLAPRDPVFWLHHGMIDYVWWLWEQYYATNYIPPNWQGQVPRPYTRWTLYDSFNERNFCFTYQRFGNAGSKKKSARKLAQAKAEKTQCLDSLPQAQQELLKKIMDDGTPEPIPQDQFKFLMMHSSSKADADRVYQQHVKAVDLAKDLKSTVTKYYSTDATISYKAPNATHLNPEQESVAGKLGDYLKFIGHVYN